MSDRKIQEYECNQNHEQIAACQIKECCLMKKIVQCAKYIHVNPSIWNPPLSGGSSALV